MNSSQVLTFFHYPFWMTELFSNNSHIFGLQHVKIKWSVDLPQLFKDFWQYAMNG
jgi:hypothetical protein